MFNSVSDSLQLRKSKKEDNTNGRLKTQNLVVKVTLNYNKIIFENVQ